MVNDVLNTPQDVIVLTTGGTIEKSYDEYDGSLENKDSIIKHIILKRLRMPYTKLHVFSLLAKDSLNFTDYDRAFVSKNIEVQLDKNWPIIVLHGTDTMAKTAEHCANTLKDLAQPVVFTGAMKPMGFDDSDATQNVTEAILASKLLKPGVYISFHNKIFTVPGVRKNREKRTFEAYKC
ncbi:asparaginase [Halobacteriovorax marinus]|uniref:Asparaginase n=1 Tax=Halobacteriovorax marinus TaxID=97084 RepID=A0A1Y5FFU2_9BACT|nr:asparaginase [Halobacteriovorax marinus]